MADGIDCPCGHAIRSRDVLDPRRADILPAQHSDDYCGAIEEAIRDHSGKPEITAAFAIDRTVALFRDAWQCPSCGRLLVFGPDGKCHSFLPESPDAPHNIFAGRSGFSSPSASPRE